MFDNFLANGSFVAVALMVFACHVMIEVGTIELKGNGYALNELPGIVRSSVGTALVIAAVPTAFWPAIYVGLFDGPIAAIIAWVAFQLAGLLVVRLLRVRGPAIGVWFILASAAMIAGYWMSVFKLPG